MRTRACGSNICARMAGDYSATIEDLLSDFLEHSKGVRGMTRDYQGIITKTATVCAGMMALHAALYVSGLHRTLGLYVMPGVNAAVCLAFTITLVFLLNPLKHGTPRTTLPWYDVLLILAGLVPCGFFIFFQATVIHYIQLGVPPLHVQIMGIILILVILEGTRRVIGWPMVIIAAFFVLHPLIAQHLPWVLHGKGFSVGRTMGHMYLTADGTFGVAAQVAATIVIMFLLFGQLLQATGVGRFFIDLAQSLLGHIRGGPALVAVVSSGFFGMISGATSANVATTGVFTIPLMKKVGYKPEFAGAVESVASNGGQYMPPVMGVVAFLIAEFLGMPYIQVCTAAVLPAILYYVGLLWQVNFEAAKLGLHGLPRTELPSIKKTLFSGWHYFLPLALLLILLIAYLYSPEKSCWWAIVSLIVVSFLKRESRLTLGSITVTLRELGRLMAMVGMACASAGLIIGSIGLSGLGMNLSGALLDVAGGNLAILLLLTAAASFVLGMGTTSIPCYIMLVILVAPALIKLGIMPIAAHLFVFWLGVASFITPPVALGSYIAAGIAAANPMRTAFISLRLGILTFIIPFIYAYNPALLLIGSTGEIVLTFITSVVGVTFFASGLSGYVLKRTGWIARIILIFAGILLIVPGWATDIVGVTTGMLPVFWQIAGRKSTHPQCERDRADAHQETD